MPTSTFYNLPPPKRNKLLRAAAAEFAQKPFDEVSINRIIQAAEIPRGSFYQYFADKRDLFQFVLHCYDRELKGAVVKALERCGGRLLEFPLALFDLVLAHIQENRAEFSQFLSILRQNLGLDVGQLLSLPELMRLGLEQADWSGLELADGEERLALLDLLFSATGQSLMGVCCGKVAAEAARRRLAAKAAVIGRGLEIRRENT